MKKLAIFLPVIIGNSVISFAQNVGIGTNATSNRLEVVSAVSAPAIASILGTNNGTTGTAIMGSSSASSTNGVVGSSTSGIGVQGYTNNNIGVLGLSSSGTALSASTITGYALWVSGNVKFAGGNTNPTNGAVLTSDAIGNATWKKSNVAFLGVKATSTSFPSGVFKKVEFVETSYDLQNNFLDYNSGTTPATSSMFTAPVSGIYHFSSNIHFFRNTGGNYYFSYADIRLVKNTSSTVIAVSRNHPFTDIFTSSDIYLKLNGDFHLDAGDKVWVEAIQVNPSGTSETLTANDITTARFSGHLVVAD